MSVRVTYSAVPVTAIKIRGEGGRGGYLPTDEGAVLRFQKWMMESEIYSISGMGGYSGGGGCLHFFSPQDASRVTAWLDSNGIVDDDEATWEDRREILEQDLRDGKLR